ncbi:MAG: hypothetical protein WC736_09715 [Gallionella sp.]|jgi:hypothetical protein
MAHNDKHSGIPFRFRRGASIGELDAESDDAYLSTCFVETGDYQILSDIGNSHRIIVGRTGAGKSALIRQLMQSEENVIEILPENLSLNYISNSDLISTLERSGVKLDLFYTLLWKHVFATELLRAKFNLLNEEKTKNWFINFLDQITRRDKNKERALTYLRDWGEKFWQETEYRVKEVTQKLETDIKDQLGATLAGLSLSANSEQKLTEAKTVEVVHKAQKIVNDIKLKALSDVMGFLADDVFNDTQQRYYIVIDKLDENWVDNDLRYRLIRALIETVKDYRKVPSVKIIVALRLDLLQSVFEKTRDAGFQEEKYESLLLHLSWSKERLESLLDERIDKLVREQYTSSAIKLRTLFPSTIGKETFVDYLFNRTLLRPRDAIAFINECIKRSDGLNQVTVQTVREAEREYSALRVASLEHEWFVQFPKLKCYLRLLERMPIEFRLSSLSKEKIDSFVIDEACDGERDSDPVIRAAFKYLDRGQDNHHSFVIELIKAFYRIGVVGIKPDGFTGQLWSFKSERAPSDGQIKPSSIIFVHPMVWGNLGCIIKK